MGRGAWAALAVAALLGAAARAPVAQAQPRPAVAAALSPDTVRVGDPFILGLAIAGPRDAEVQFPPLLTLAPELEQLSPADVRWDAAGGGRWQEALG